MDIPQAVRDSLGQVRGRFQALCHDAKWARMEGVHVTLKFIGEVPPERVEPIRAALGAIAPRPPIELRFAGLGFFPSELRPSVFWAGIDGGAPLRELAADIETQLAPVGVAREEREFHPHLTLARFDASSEHSLGPLRAAAGEFAASEFGRVTADEFHLYRSVLKSTGAEYTRLATYRLSPEPVS